MYRLKYSLGHPVRYRNSDHLDLSWYWVEEVEIGKARRLKQFTPLLLLGPLEIVPIAVALVFLFLLFFVAVLKRLSVYSRVLDSTLLHILGRKVGLIVPCMALKVAFN